MYVHTCIQPPTIKLDSVLTSGEGWSRLEARLLEAAPPRASRPWWSVGAVRGRSVGGASGLVQGAGGWPKRRRHRRYRSSDPRPRPSPNRQARLVARTEKHEKREMLEIQYSVFILCGSCIQDVYNIIERVVHLCILYLYHV